MKTMSANAIWPNDSRCAVSVTFDDGRDSQLTRAVPHLDERGLRATFYVPMRSKNHMETCKPWITVAEQGHEIGNHSKSHFCSRNFSFRRIGLEDITLDEIEEDILAAEAILRELIPNQTERTFAYPCYQTFVGEGQTRQSYVPVVARHFVAARSTGEYGCFNDPLRIDLHCLNCVSYGHRTGVEIIGQIERCVRRRQWIIVTYHGINEGRPEHEFVEVLDHLADRQDHIWTAPVVEVAKHVIEVRQQTACK